jgi:hypothetical protein
MLTAIDRGDFMDVYVEGLFSKKVIVKLLEDYHSLGEIKIRTTNYAEERSSSSSVKSDGVSGRIINKMMIDQALKAIPDQKVRYCAVALWIQNKRPTVIAKQLGISRPTFYKYKSEAIDFIYRHVNGERAGVKDLLDTILK